VADRVIGVGDPLFGSTVVSLELYRQALNDAGQLAFVAGLADGRRVVVRVDNATAGGIVPEPSAAVLVGVGACGLVFWSLRRERKRRVAGEEYGTTADV
jgi:hypothetical protein